MLLTNRKNFPKVCGLIIVISVGSFELSVGTAALYFHNDMNEMTFLSVPYKLISRKIKRHHVGWEVYRKKVQC